MHSSDQNPPACLSCGTCCFSELERYVPVTGDDHARLDALAEPLTNFVGNRCFMRMEDGHCAALKLDPEGGQFRCSVYEQRPAICRELQRGSAQCAAEISLKGARPDAALQRLKTLSLRPAACPGTSET